MTFLEWLLTELIGEPTRRNGNGESTWPCPKCGNARFHTLPDKPPFKHRAKCWACGFRGDAADMLQAFYPDEPWGDRKDRLDAMTKQYAAEHAGISPRGRGETEEERERLAAAMSEVSAFLRDGPADWTKGKRELDILRAFAIIAEIAYQNGVGMDRLAGHVAKYVLSQKYPVKGGKKRK
jgi:hypothetical protein